MNKCLHIQIFIYSHTHSLTYTTRPHSHSHRHIHQTAHIKLSVKQTFIDLSPLESVTKLTFVLHAHRGRPLLHHLSSCVKYTANNFDRCILPAFFFKEEGNPHLPLLILPHLNPISSHTNANHFHQKTTCQSSVESFFEKQKRNNT